MKSFQLTIAKVSENVYEGEAVAAILPGSEGEFTVLAHHEPFITTLANGSARVKETESDEYIDFAIQGGIAEISSNRATIIL